MNSRKQNIETFFCQKQYLIAGLFCAMLLLNSCVKKILEKKAEDFFVTNYLNTDFIVDLATDSTSDLTAQYDGYVFRLLQNTLKDGPVTAKKNAEVFTGTWITNDDYSKLTILINQPSILPEFNFLNREWRFADKNLPILGLTPWGSLAPTKLNLRKL